jgi:hypothetical protein
VVSLCLILPKIGTFGYRKWKDWKGNRFSSMEDDQRASLMPELNVNLHVQVHDGDEGEIGLPEHTPLLNQKDDSMNFEQKSLVIDISFKDLGLQVSIHSYFQ